MLHHGGATVKWTGVKSYKMPRFGSCKVAMLQLCNILQFLSNFGKMDITNAKTPQYDLL